MKKIFFLATFLVASLGFSQEKRTVYERSGDLVKATYYNEEGKISVQGFFKDKKLTGKWVSFDNTGKKKQIAYYKKGKKVGKWIIFEKNFIKEINYDDNIIVSVQDWKSEAHRLANN